ncbi:MAG: DUF4625 domain-containing protein [Flavobacteriales bacterium]|nr:DUF4625 domain-containing protein [Flavobacteriales bacterium]
MRTHKIIALAMLVMASTIVGCNKDEEDPTITISAPNEHTHYVPDESFKVTATFADDQDLASYEVMIGDIDGEHVEGFHQDFTDNISGMSHSFSETITVPDTLPGVMMFYLHFKVTDAEGKTASDKLMLHYDDM